jgi:hypothetical protein
MTLLPRTTPIGVVLVLAGLSVLAGCTAPINDLSGEDRIGWENGYSYNDSLSVTPADGYNESERTAVLARTMARVEHIRNEEFTENVTVRVVSSDEYEGRPDRDRSPEYQAWNDQVWEALFIVGEDRNVSNVLDRTFSASVAGSYTPRSNELVIVTSNEDPRLDRQTLAHELVHALQDQHWGFITGRDTQDGRLAGHAVVEGDAVLVRERYEERCDANWSCLPRPDRRRTGSAADADFDLNVFSVLFHPYSEGPRFVETIHDQSGWEGVTALYDEPPVSTEQIIHPERYPDEEPVSLTVEDRSTSEWSRYELSRHSYETAGEVSIAVMLASTGTLDEDTGPYRYNYSATTGWGNDKLVPYHDDAGRGGYVWKLAWDSEADAREFTAAYERLLEARGTARDEPGVYVLPETDAFGDAFRVTRTGETVRIVNGPTVAALDAIDSPA